MKPEPDPPPDPSPPCDEQELCPQCLTGNVPGSHFCRNCGSPLSAHAAIGPFEHLFAEGHVYRRATADPRKFIVLLGIWLIFGPAALLSVALAPSAWRERNLFGLLLMLAILTVSMSLIIKTTRNYLASRSTAKRSVDPGK